MTRRRKNPRATVGAGVELRRRFRVALAHAGTTEAAWARHRGLTQTHVREVVLGNRNGGDLLTSVIEWTAAQEERLRAQMATATVLVA